MLIRHGVAVVNGLVSTAAMTLTTISASLVTRLQLDSWCGLEEWRCNIDLSSVEIAAVSGFV